MASLGFRVTQTTALSSMWRSHMAAKWSPFGHLYRSVWSKLVFCGHLQ